MCSCFDTNNQKGGVELGVAYCKNVYNVRNKCSKICTRFCGMVGSCYCLKRVVAVVVFSKTAVTPQNMKTTLHLVLKSQNLAVVLICIYLL